MELENLVDSGYSWIMARPSSGCTPLGAMDSIGNLPRAIITDNFGFDDDFINYVNNIKGLNIPIIQMTTGYVDFVSSEDEKLFNEVCIDLDIFVYLPKCAAFSGLSKSKKDGSTVMEASENNNLFSLTELVMRSGAKTAVMESNAGLINDLGFPVREHLRDIGIENGYSLLFYITKAELHGNPQHRERIYISFFKDKCPIPEFQDKKVPVSDYLNEHLAKRFNKNYDGVQFMNILTEYDELHKDKMSGSEVLVDIYMSSPFRHLIENRDKKTFFSIGEPILRAGKLEEFLEYLETIEDDYPLIAEFVIKSFQNYVKNTSEGRGIWPRDPIMCREYVPCIITKNMHLLIHPNGKRLLDVNEVMTFMGFPGDFKFSKETSSHLRKSIGQNTPRLVTKDILDTHVRYLDKDIPLSDSKSVEFNNVLKRVVIDYEIALELDNSCW